MKRRSWLLFVGVLVFLFAAYLAVSKAAAARDEAAFQEQIRLARAEGIPTTAAEFAATVPTAKPTENAAPLYRKLKLLDREKADVTEVERTLIFHPTPANVAAAQAILSNHKMRPRRSMKPS